MPYVRYERADTRVRIEADGAGSFRISLHDEDLRAEPGPDAVHEVAARLADAGFDSFVARDAEVVAVSRIAISTDAAAARFPWERWLVEARPSLAAAVLCRISDVPPRVADTPLRLPARMLQVGGYGLRQAVMRAFGDRGADAVSLVVRVDDVDPDGFEDWLRVQQWPTIDMLVVDVDRVFGDLLTARRPGGVGTLGWLRRVTHAMATRVVEIRQGGRPTAEVLGLAAALCAEGGPAVVVVPSGAEDTLLSFYENLVHDRPLDVAAALAHRPAPGSSSPLVVFGGVGREELLRFSVVATELIDVVEAALGRAVSPGSRDQVDRVVRCSSADISAEDVADAVNVHIGPALEHLRFEDAESEGLLPLGKAVGRVRMVLGLEGTEPVRVAPELGPRFVNAVLHERSADGRRDEKLSRPLERGTSVILAVDIGPLGDRPAVGVVPLLEELLQWSPDDEGRFVEIGVTGLDFAVTGSPVQEVWVPRDAPSQVVSFVVTPQRAGASVLRFSVFVDGNVVQSFRIGGVTDEADRDLLCRLLGITLDQLGAMPWHSRMEFSMVGSEAAFAEERPATLSIVANAHDGVPVITVKGTDLFNVATNADTPQLVSDVRAALSDISGQLAYRFSKNAESLNEGSDDKLEEALMKLAPAGWALYDAVFQGADRAELAAVTAAAGSIRVAHVLLERSIPWAALYDRPYDSGRQAVGGVAVQQRACLAALPVDGGAIPDEPCGTSTACPLHPDNLPVPLEDSETYSSVVACARHLWGFRHRIELPPAQTDGGPTSALPDKVSAATPPRLGVAMHAGLARSIEHLQDLTALVAPAWTKWARDEVVDTLSKDTDIDVVYLYCHAEGGEGTGIAHPALRFQAEGGPEGRVRADHLGNQKWAHHPVVVLNGCHTAAFRSDALSPFVRKFVFDRGASGVLATEITVWEFLAGEVGLAFVSSLLGGADAGDALLAARRRLLAKRNPLGLAYTLFARSDLRLATG